MQLKILSSTYVGRYFVAMIEVVATKQPMYKTNIASTNSYALILMQGIISSRLSTKQFVKVLKTRK